MPFHSGVNDELAGKGSLHDLEVCIFLAFPMYRLLMERRQERVWESQARASPHASGRIQGPHFFLPLIATVATAQPEDLEPMQLGCSKLSIEKRNR